LFRGGESIAAISFEPLAAEDGVIVKD